MTRLLRAPALCGALLLSLAAPVQAAGEANPLDALGATPLSASSQDSPAGEAWGRGASPTPGTPAAMGGGGAPTPGTVPAPIPLDGGLSLLALAGAGLAARRLRQRSR